MRGLGIRARVKAPLAHTDNWYRGGGPIIVDPPPLPLEMGYPPEVVMECQEKVHGKGGCNHFHCYSCQINSMSDGIEGN